MEAKCYPIHYTPLYQALIVAIDGEDRLLQLQYRDASTGCAPGIHENIAANLKLYPLWPFVMAADSQQGDWNST